MCPKQIHKKNEFLEIIHDETVLSVRIRRSSAARCMILRFSKATREASLTLPSSVPLDYGRAFIRKQAGWLAKKQKETPARIYFEEGIIIPIRGIDHRLLRKDGRGITHIEQDTDIPALIAHCAPEHFARRITTYLKQEALRDLQQAVFRFSAQIDKKVMRITLRDTRSRWGSCSSSGSLNFSWRLIFAPSFVLEYLAAHEVAHLKEMNHSRNFWALTYQLFPETDKAETWLKKAGYTLHLYG